MKELIYKYENKIISLDKYFELLEVLEITEK